MQEMLTLELNPLSCLHVKIAGLHSMHMTCTFSVAIKLHNEEFL